MLYLNTMLAYTQYQHNAEVNPIFVHCWAFPNLKTLSYYNAEIFRILKYCCFITCLVTLLSYSPIYNVAEAYFSLFC